MKKDFFDLTKKELEKLPRRRWDKESEYKSLIFYLGKNKKGFWSGKGSFPYYELIGLKDDGTWEGVSHLDDMCIGGLIGGLIYEAQIIPFRMDCNRAGVFRFWGNDIRFHVGHANSSTDVRIVSTKGGEK